MRPCSHRRPGPELDGAPPGGWPAPPPLPLASVAAPAPGQTRRRVLPRGRQRAPQPAPFTAPLALQTVTLATNLSAASRAPAGPGRGARSLEPRPPGPAPRARPRPRRPGARSHWATSYARPLLGLRPRLRLLLWPRGERPDWAASRRRAGALAVPSGSDGGLERVLALLPVAGAVPARRATERLRFRSRADEALACWLAWTSPAADRNPNGCAWGLVHPTPFVSARGTHVRGWVGGRACVSGGVWPAPRLHGKERSTLRSAARRALVGRRRGEPADAASCSCPSGGG